MSDETEEKVGPLVGSDTDTLMNLMCGDCIIRVVGYRENDPTWEKWSSVFIEVISGSQERWYAQWRVRLRNAWSVLRNNYGWAGFQITGQDELERFIGVMQDTSTELFGQRPYVSLPRTLFDEEAEAEFGQKWLDQMKPNG